MRVAHKSDRHLRVVDGEALALSTTPRPLPSLDAQPFRPGELSEPLRLELDPCMSEIVAREAAAAGVPTELWVRVAVESARHVERATATLGIDRELAVRHLDMVCVERHPVAPIHGQRHREYGDRIDAAQARAPRPPRRDLTLLLPDQLIAAWSLQAATRSATLEAWAAAMLASAPPAPMGWEAAAARCAETLGEWILVRLAEASTTP